MAILNYITEWSGSQLSKIILNNTYTLRYVFYTYYFILGLGLGLGLILYYFAELAAGPISTSIYNNYIEDRYPC